MVQMDISSLQENLGRGVMGCKLGLAPCSESILDYLPQISLGLHYTFPRERG